MSRIILSDIARGKIDNVVTYKQKNTEEYQKLVDEANKKIELDLIRRGKVEMAAKSYISI